MATKEKKEKVAKNPSVMYSFYGGKVTLEVKPWGDYFRYIRIDGNGTMLSPSAVTDKLDKSKSLIPWAVGQVCGHITSSFEARTGKSFSKEEIYLIVEEARTKPEEKKVAGSLAGDLIHDYAHEFAKAVLSKSPLPKFDHLDPENEVHARAINGISAFLDFYNGNKVEFIEMEEVIYYNSFYAGDSKEGEPIVEYAGRKDLFAKINGNLEVIDYKSSKGVYSSQRYQVAGYLKAHNSTCEKKMLAKGYRILNFSKDTGELIEKYVSLEEAEEDFKAFKGLYAVALREKALDAEYRAGKKAE